MLPVDFEGTDPEKPQKGESGQSYGAGAKPSGEQIAAWGGLATSEKETNDGGEKAVTMPIPRDYDKP